MKLIVGYQTITVRPMPKGNSSDEDAYGMFRPFEAAIDISLDGAPHVQAEALVHETLHAIWRATALGKQKVDEETAVTALARGLTQVMRDNPQWAAAVIRAADGGVLLPKAR